MAGILDSIYRLRTADRLRDWSCARDAPERGSRGRRRHEVAAPAAGNPDTSHCCAYCAGWTRPGPPRSRRGCRCASLPRAATGRRWSGGLAAGRPLESTSAVTLQQDHIASHNPSSSAPIGEVESVLSTSGAGVAECSQMQIKHQRRLALGRGLTGLHWFLPRCSFCT